MRTGLQALVMLGLLYAGSSTAHAQGLLPTEEQLNPAGLTLMWYGQAIIDRSRDQVEFITADEQNVYIQSRTGILTCFGIESGRQLWSALLGAPDHVGYAAASNDRELLVTSGLTIYSLDKMTGNVLWELLIPTLPSASPEVDETTAYVGTVDGSVYAYDLARVRQLHKEGRLPQWAHLARLWRYKTPREIIAPPISTGATVAFASRQGLVIGVAAKSKKLKFQFETDAQIRTPVGRSNELIFVTEKNGRLYCLNQDNGTMRWAFSTGAPIDHQPRVVGPQVFVVPYREGLECVSVASGYRQWNQKKVTEFIAASEDKVYASDL
ncbi:MAG: PQQ-like beta-propeller repeat protein, partial [Planctomycetaceae bacterium]|nr:PQQ-like beta-propeller repeat protein [Planctomycetaceae bacterium]